jgi:flagellar FliL protein
MADETSDDGAASKQQGGMMKMVISGLGIFVLVLAAAVIAPLINNAIYGPPQAVMPAAEGGSKGTGEESMPDPSALEPALYQPLEPPLVINFEAEDGSTRYLQMSVQVMARDQAVIDAVKTHAPAIRNNFLFIIGNRDYASLATVEGKEKLRAEMLDETRAILQRNTGSPGVEEIYFTSFVMQ